MRSAMGEDLYDQITKFIEKRRLESQDADIGKKASDDLERYEVE
jgi:hypothetical protein